MAWHTCLSSCTTDLSCHTFVEGIFSDFSKKTCQTNQGYFFLYRIAWQKKWLYGCCADEVSFCFLCLLAGFTVTRQPFVAPNVSSTQGCHGRHSPCLHAWYGVADRTTLNEWRTHKGRTELKRKPIPTQTADGPHRMAAWRCWSRSQAWLAIFSIILKGWKLQYRSRPPTDMGRHCRHCLHLLLNFCIPQQTPSLLTNRQVEIAF